MLILHRLLERLAAQAEELGEVLGEDVEQKGDDEAHAGGHQRAVFPAALDAVVLERADVLAREGGDGHVRAEDGDERIALHAVAGVEGAHRDLAEAVDEALDEHVAQGHDGLLDYGRDAELEADAELLRVEHEFAAPESEDGVAAHHIYYTDRGAGGLGYDRGHGDAHDAPAEADDEPEVEHGVEHGADAEEVHARPAVAHRTEYARYGVVDVLEDEAHGVDGEVLDGVSPAGLVRDTHEAHDQQLGAEAAEDGERGAQAGLGYEQRGGRPPELMFAPCAVELGDEHASAVGKAQGDGQKEEDERGAAAHGGEHGVRYLLRRPAVAADDDAVHRVVQLLQKLAGHDRQRKEQYLLPLRADGHISPVQVLTPLIS